MPAKVDRSALLGKRFGLWTCVSIPDAEAPRADGRKSRPSVTCRCECGVERRVNYHSLIAGKSNGCGCQIPAIQRRCKTTHGCFSRGKQTPEYSSWAGMIRRCHNRKSHGYKTCGAKGIAVCQEWRDSFEAFLEHIGPKPSAGMILNRIRPNEGYEPGNVRWASRIGQSRNKRNTRRAFFRGEHRSMGEIAEMCGLSYGVIHHRSKLGWEGEELALPLQTKLRKAARVFDGEF